MKFSYEKNLKKQKKKLNLTLIISIIFLWNFGQLSFGSTDSPALPAPSDATEIMDHPVHGEWLYYGYFYKNNFFPPNDPKLKLTFGFKKDGSYRLYWTRFEDLTKFCEARGTYEILEDKIHTNILWVNPDNQLDCSADPDMREGRKTSTSFKFDKEKDELQLFLPLSDDFLIYALKRISATNP